MLAYGYVAIALFNVFWVVVSRRRYGSTSVERSREYFFIRHSHLLSDFSTSSEPQSNKGKKRAGVLGGTRPLARAPVGPSPAVMAEVDRILAKVRDQGLASLSEREKTTLRDATEAQRRG